MERQSDKHSPRTDDDMKKDAGGLTRGTPVDPRAQESRAPEPPADGEPNPDEVISTTMGRASLSHAELELRHDLARFLDNTIWPATREEILVNAAEHNAPDHVIERFAAMPPGRYDGFPLVWETISGHHEPRSH
jgi:hypothetical protein